MATDLFRVARTTAAATLLLLLAASPARADSMRCGSRLISDGDSIEKVLHHCGEPTYKYRTWIVRQPQFEFGNDEIAFPGREDVPVDYWTYDLGPNQLMRKLRFVAGELQSIETLDYGSR
jgi:hypothetical protein